VSTIAAIDERRLSTTLLGRSIAVIGLLALGGCGSSSLVVPNASAVAQSSSATQTATTSRPKPASRRHTAPARRATTTSTTPTRHNFTAGYPSRFATSFLTRCESRSTTTACTCLLTTVEHSVPYSTVVASIRTIVAGKQPGWYSRAAQQC
jgi:hypothetical protein